MISRDYHNHTLSQAMEDVSNVIGHVRLKGERKDAEFITGRGVICEELLKVLSAHGLFPSLKLGNDGVVVCVIE